mgnify:CR=1 FL=1
MQSDAVTHFFEEKSLRVKCEECYGSKRISLEVLTNTLRSYDEYP